MDPVVFVPIPETLKTIVDDMRDLIAKKETDHLRVDATGWQYGGSGFLTLVRNLENDMKNQGFHVYGSTVRHFFKGANILNPYYPEKQLLIIPMNGISTISPDDQLPHDTYCYIKDKHKPTLYGDEIDVIIVAFEEKAGNMKHDSRAWCPLLASS